jgi:hypothetical protein
MEVRSDAIQGEKLEEILGAARAFSEPTDSRDFPDAGGL